MSHDSIEDAKADADAHRAGLVDALSALLSTRLPDSLGYAATDNVAETARMVATHGAKAVRSNPASLALIGAGVALLAMPRRAESAPAPTSAPAPLSAEADTRIEKAQERHAQEARIRADQVDIGPGRAQALRIKLDEGLGKLSPDARARVRAARLKAVKAQEALEQRAARASQSAQTTFQTRPVATMIAIAGVGALIGAMLPTTRRETELMGAKRDQLLRDAEAVLREEISHLEARGKAAVDSGMAAVRQEVSSALDDRPSHH